MVPIRVWMNHFSVCLRKKNNKDQLALSSEELDKISKVIYKELSKLVAKYISDSKVFLNLYQILILEMGMKDVYLNPNVVKEIFKWR